MSDSLATVEAVVSRWLAPLIARDGGTIRLVSFEDDVATIELGAACTGCPAKPITRDLVVTPLLTKELGRPITVRLE